MRTLLPLLLVLLVTGPAYTQGPISLLAAPPQEEPEVDPNVPRFMERSTEGDRVTTYYLTLSPKSPEPPVLRYRLLPTWGEMVEGNAATQYHRAILVMQQQTANVENSMDKLWMPLEEWREMPLDQLPIEEVERTLAPFDNILQEVHFGARRTHCDWGLPFQEMRRDVFMIMLEEIQQARNLSRLLSVRIRLRLAQGRFDEAMEDFQTGTALARHVGEETFIVGNLVGIAVSEMYNIQLMTALTLEDAPNLYWSITNVPQPLVDFRSSLEIESQSPFMMFPELLAARTETRDEVYWNETLIGMLERLEGLHSGSPQQPKTTSEKLESTAKLAYVFSHVPAARKALVQAMGYSAEEVAQMPGSRALLVYSGHAFEAARDRDFSLFGLPYVEAVKRFKDFEKDPADGVDITGMFLPATEQYYTAIVRSQRTFALLRTVEALRDFVATHDRVPQSLEEVTTLPVPVNPLTGNPFEYQIEDAPARKVILETGGNVNQAPLRLKITFRE